MDEDESVGSVLSTVRWLTSVLKTLLRVLLFRTVGSRSGVWNSPMDSVADDITSISRPTCCQSQPATARCRTVTSTPTHSHRNGTVTCGVQATLDENGNPIDIELRGENSTSLNMPNQQQQQPGSTSNRCGNADLSRSTRMKNGEVKNAVKVESRQNAVGLDVAMVTTDVTENQSANNRIELPPTELLTPHSDDNLLNEILEAVDERSTSSAASINSVSARRKRSNKKKGRRRSPQTVSVSVMASDNAGIKHPAIQLPTYEHSMTQRLCDGNVSVEAAIATVVAGDVVATVNDCATRDRRSDGDGEDEDTIVRHAAMSTMSTVTDCISVDESRHSNDMVDRSANVAVVDRVQDNVDFSCESHRRTLTTSHSHHRDTASPLSPPPCSTRRRKMTPETHAWSSVATGVHSNGYRTKMRNTVRLDATVVAEETVETCLQQPLVMTSNDSSCSPLEQRQMQSSLATNRLTVADRTTSQLDCRVKPKMFDANATRAFLYDAFQEVSKLSTRSRYKSRRPMVVVYSDRQH